MKVYLFKDHADTSEYAAKVLIDQLKTGKTAIFIIFQTEEAGIGIPISLSGFSQALAALQ